jgi:hypothetical protein
MTDFAAKNWHSTLYRDTGLVLVESLSGRDARETELAKAYELTRRFVREHDAEERLAELEEEHGIVLDLDHRPGSDDGEYAVVRLIGDESEVVGSGDTPTAAVADAETGL